MSVPKRIVNLIDAKNEEILRLERLVDESEHALGFAIDRVERLEAEKAEMLAVLEELRESASYWSEYDVPVGIVERIESAIRKARGEE